MVGPACLSTQSRHKREIVNRLILGLDFSEPVGEYEPGRLRAYPLNVPVVAFAFEPSFSLKATQLAKSLRSSLDVSICGVTFVDDMAFVFFCVDA